MSDPPPLRLALPPDLGFEGTAAPPPPPPAAPPAARPTPVDVGGVADEITTTLRQPDGFDLDLGATTLDRPPAHDDSHDDRHADPHDDSDDSEDGTSITGRRVRPYTITGGRTAVVGPEIPFEAQVLTSNRRPADATNYRWETARLVEMVEVPMALVEVAARLEVPVGVARVLVSDLVTEGVLIIHLPPPASSFTSLLEQVLDGVRKL